MQTKIENAIDDFLLCLKWLPDNFCEAMKFASLKLTEEEIQQLKARLRQLK